jgi:hypothetical protein
LRLLLLLALLRRNLLLSPTQPGGQAWVSHLGQILVHDCHQPAEQQHVHCNALANAGPLHLDSYQLATLTQHALIHLGG